MSYASRKISSARRIYTYPIKKQPSPAVRKMIGDLYQKQKQGINMVGFALDTSALTDDLLMKDCSVKFKPRKRNKIMYIEVEGWIPLLNDKWVKKKFQVKGYVSGLKQSCNIPEVWIMIQARKNKPYPKIVSIKMFYSVETYNNIDNGNLGGIDITERIPQSVIDSRLREYNRCFEMGYMTVKYRSGLAPGVDGVVPRFTEESFDSKKESMNSSVLQKTKSAWKSYYQKAASVSFKDIDKVLPPSILIPDVSRMLLIPKITLNYYLTGKPEKFRPLSIPIVRDRIVGTMLYYYTAPVLEQLFCRYSYGFRPNKDITDAIIQSIGFLKEGYRKVVQLDLADFFENINHDLLYKQLTDNFNDVVACKYIVNYFLKHKIKVDFNGSRTLNNGYLPQETIDKYKVKDNTRREKGVPQGSSFSPVLANLFMDKFDRHLINCGIRFVRYADDVVLFFSKDSEIRMKLPQLIDYLENEMLVPVNNNKTKIIDNNFLTVNIYGFSINNKGKILMNAENILRAKLKALEIMYNYKGKRENKDKKKDEEEDNRTLEDRVTSQAMAYAHFYGHLAEHCFEDIDAYWSNLVAVSKWKSLDKIHSFAEKEIKNIIEISMSG